MKTKIFIFAIFAQLFSITASAYDAEIDGIYYNFSGTETTLDQGDEGNEQNNMVVNLTVERYCGWGYQMTDASINLDELKSFLGVEEITEDMLSIVNPDGSEVFDYALYDGWFNAEGAATNWGSTTAICVKFFQILSDGNYTICDMNGVDEVGKEYTATWKVTNGEKSVRYNIITKFIEKPELDYSFADLTVKETKVVTVHSKLGNCYESLSAYVDLDNILNVLGVENINEVKIFAVLSDGTLDEFYQKGTTDGWRDANGDWKNWGNDAYFCAQADFTSLPQIIISGKDGKNTIEEKENPPTYEVRYAFVKNGSEDYKSVILSVKLIYDVPNMLNVAAQTIVAGNSATVEIKLKNDQADLVAFQMDLTLPEGVSLDKDGCSLSSRITDQEQELAIGKLSYNVYRLTSSSLSLTPIEGNNGTLLSLKLNAEDGCVNGKATISNILFSTANSERITMIDESFDINIMYKQIYTVDGEEYKSYNVVYNSQPTFETEPIKAGYTFGGWSELPETMPNHDIVVTGRFYLYGDVNTDEEVDVVDVVDIARFVVANPSSMFREKLADLNSDETVNLGDAVVLVNHIAGDQNFVKPMFAPSICADNDATLRMTKNGKAISLEMTNSRDYTAFQFDLYMLEDADVTQMQLNVQRKQTHSMLYNKVGNGHYRVAVLSPSNITINGNNGELLSFVIDGGTSSDVSIKNIQFFDTKGNAYLFDAVGIDTETSIDSVVTINNNEAGAVYDLQGRKLSKVQRGVNIVGGKALIVK